MRYSLSRPHYEMHADSALDDALSRLGARLGGVLVNPTPEDIAKLVSDRLSEAAETDEKRARAAGASRPTLDRWRKAGDRLKIGALRKLAQATGRPIIVRFDPDTEREAPRPEWAEGLETRIALEVARQLVDPKARTALRELVRRTESTPPPSGATAHEDVSAQDQVG